LAPVLAQQTYPVCNIASTGNATDFGDLTKDEQHLRLVLAPMVVYSLTPTTKGETLERPHHQHINTALTTVKPEYNVMLSNIDAKMQRWCVTQVIPQEPLAVYAGDSGEFSHHANP